MSKVKPDIAVQIDTLEDENLKEILRRIYNDNRDQNQMQDFIHIEICHTEAQTGLKVAHNLGFIPKDISPLKVVGPGTIKFNYCKFDKQNLDYDVTGKIRGRFFVGTNIQDESRVPDEVTDIQEFRAQTVTSAGLERDVKTVTTDTTLTGDEYLVLGDHKSIPFTITLPPAADNDQKQLAIQNINSATVTLDGHENETISGSLTVLLDKDDTLTIVSNGSAWFVV